MKLLYRQRFFLGTIGVIRPLSTARKAMFVCRNDVEKLAGVVYKQDGLFGVSMACSLICFQRHTLTRPFVSVGVYNMVCINVIVEA